MVLLLITTVRRHGVGRGAASRRSALTRGDAARHGPRVGLASAFNHVLDRDIDALMTRTANRPVASGAHLAARRRDLRHGCSRSPASASCWPGRTGLAAALALAGSAFYVVVYTMLLKRRTPQNIVIGGAAGAIPPLVGWAAMTGGDRAGAAGDVPDHLPVDAAPLLGAGDAARATTTRAPACRCCRWSPRARDDRRPDPRLHRAADDLDADPGRARPARRRLPRGGGRARRALHAAGGAPAALVAAWRPRARRSSTRSRTWRSCSWPWAPDRAVAAM